MASRGSDREFLSRRSSRLAATFSAMTIGMLGMWASPAEAVPAVTIADVTVSEAAGTATITVDLGEPNSTGGNVTVDYVTSDGTAVTPDDYNSIFGTFTVPPTSRTSSTTLPILDDAIDEPDETLVVTISNYQGATGGIADPTAVVTITDDDPTPGFMISDELLLEGHTSAFTVVFSIYTSGASSAVMTVDYTTADQSATAPSDYATRSGTLTFSPGDPVEYVTVPVVSDTKHEPDEIFFLNISNPTNATIADPQGETVIYDDDAIPALSISDPTVIEGGSGTTTATFAVTLSTATSQTVTVGYSTADGTATSPDDYAAASGTLTFTPDDTSETINVPVAGDTVEEGNETFVVNLSGAVNAALPDAQATATITEGGGAPTGSTSGYWLARADGATTAFGNADPLGFQQEPNTNAPVVGLAATSSSDGLWLAAADGGVFSFGEAEFHGSMGGTPINAPIVGIARGLSDAGYWLAAADGGVFAFGDAEFHGSMGGTPLNAPIVGIAATDSGDGYWLAAADGGVFTFGDAEFHGSQGGTPLNAPVVGIAATESGNGYRLFAADGGVFTFGDAEFEGSGTADALAPVVGGASS